jgi:Putative prokaryotic signal transducing protein
LDIDPEELRRGYDELSDEGLLSIHRMDLTELARPIYDAEVARRGLHSETEHPHKANSVAKLEEDLVLVATFLSFHEAEMGRDLLRSADIPAYLESELSSAWTGAGGLRLKVPTSFLEQAEEILNAQISDEDLIAQAEAASSVEPIRDEDQMQ